MFISFFYSRKETSGFYHQALKLIFAAGFFLLFFSGRASGSEPIATGIVEASKLHIRSTPNQKARSLKILYKGTKVKVINIETEWLKIWHHGQEGYIRNRKRYVRILAPSEKKETKQLSSDLSVTQKSRQLEKKSKDISREIEKHRTEVLTFTKKETALVERLNEIDWSINHARKQILVFKTELAFIKKKIRETTQASRKLKQEIVAGEVYMSRRLIALYKLNWLGRVQILASAESMYELFQRKAALERILEYDEKIRQQLIANRARFEKILNKLNDQKKQRLAVDFKHKAQSKVLSNEKERRSKLLEDIRNKKSLELAAIDALNRAARALDQTIKFLNVRKQAPQKIKELPEKPFIKLKGLLNMPVKGKVTTDFGLFKNTRFNVRNFRSGIDIQADRGEPIRAVSSGKILYSSWFKGYGNMVIIDHGNSYYTIYAHAEEIFKSKGDRVDTNDVIATVGDTGSMKGPGLYFEVRHRGKPLDPIDWIKKG